ncbi:6896_t:CDS:2, partial [Acaulospora morrowiae]
NLDSATQFNHDRARSKHVEVPSAQDTVMRSLTVSIQSRESTRITDLW